MPHLLDRELPNIDELATPLAMIVVGLGLAPVFVQFGLVLLDVAIVWQAVLLGYGCIILGGGLVAIACNGAYRIFQRLREVRAQTAGSSQNQTQ